MTHDKKQSQNIYVPPALRKTCAETDSIKNKNLSEDIVNNNDQNLSGLQKQLERLTVSNPKRFGSSGSTSNSSKDFEKKTNFLGKHILSNSNLSDLREPPCLNYDNYRHILEFYNFSKDVQTCQFEAELVGFENSGFYLKWVDDVHCLAVFSSDNEANRALSQISGLFMKVILIAKKYFFNELKLNGLICFCLKVQAVLSAYFMHCINGLLNVLFRCKLVLGLAELKIRS